MFYKHLLTISSCLCAKHVNDKKDVRIAFCDHSHAFDRVWHQGLLYKLDCIGITAHCFKWLQSLMDNRQQLSIAHMWFKLSVEHFQPEYPRVHAWGLYYSACILLTAID